MRTISKERGSVYCGSDSWSTIKKEIENYAPSSIYILADSQTAIHCVPIVLKKLDLDNTIAIITMNAGEEHKNITTCTKIWERLAALGADRKSLLINIGGGVVTDLGGFIAATYMRGIESINIPTSLLAMVDAAVGGKNGVDLGVLKNQIGIIRDPLLVVVDTIFLKTLPKEEITSGYAEMLKHGIIYKKEYWDQLKRFSVDDVMTTEILIWESIAFKNDIVTKDPREQKERKTLNFGHTLGHAIESYCLEVTNRKKLLHGNAIAIGMILAAYISNKQSMLSDEHLNEITTTIQQHFKKESFNSDEIKVITTLLKHDKKNTAGVVNFVLLSDYGKTLLNQQVAAKLINEAFEYYNNLR